MKKEKSEDIVIKETFEGGLKYSLYSNFKKWTDAFLELVDNAVSNRITGKKLLIEIGTSRKHFRITNKGGSGMTLDDLRGFSRWGEIKKRSSYDLGAYSQGGKAAMGYLGHSMKVKASPDKIKDLYVFEDYDLHDYRLKEYKVSKFPTDLIDGYVEIEVSGLKRPIENEELELLMKETYRPLIDSEEIEIYINGKIIKTDQFPLDKDFKIENFSFQVENGNKNYESVSGWIGRLIPKSGVRGGLKCYKLGRLICDREYFGQHDANYKHTLNFLFGEIYLNHVPATTNKTDFDRDSDEWHEISEKMFVLLQPHIDELLGRGDIQEPTDEEKERVKKAKEIVEELLKMKKMNFEGKSLSDIYTQGQKAKENLNVRPGAVNNHDPKRKNNPATPPPQNATGKRRRIKEFMDWDVRAMDEAVRSKIETEEGKRLLVINNLFPGYKAAKGHYLYLIETAAIQLSRPDKDEKLTPEEYIEDFDNLYSFFCSNLDTAKEKLEDKKRNKLLK